MLASLALPSLVRLLADFAHSFACFGLLASLVPSAALARSLRSLPRSWESEFLMSQNDLVWSHNVPGERKTNDKRLHFIFFSNIILLPPSAPLPLSSLNLAAIYVAASTLS